jgi:hypothetical protein
MTTLCLWPAQAGIHLPFEDPTFTATAAADMVAEEAAAAADDRPPLRELSPYSSRTDELQGLWEVSLTRRSCQVVRLLHWFVDALKCRKAAHVLLTTCTLHM